MVDWKMIPRVTIEVEPDLIDLIPDFLARKRADLATIKAALDGGDLYLEIILGRRAPKWDVRHIDGIVLTF